MVPRALTAFALAVSPVASLRARPGWAADEGALHKVANLESYTFAHFVRDFQRTYEEGSEEWAAREALFNRRISKMVEHNTDPGRSWRMGLSKFMDYTEVEKRFQLGYTGRGKRTQATATGKVIASLGRSEVPSSFSVAVVAEPRNEFLSIIRDQGNCGSCWAAAAAAALEGQMAVNNTLMEELEAATRIDKRVPGVPSLSTQTMLSCTDNPHHCGGTGGCHGATAELAYGAVIKHGGLPFASEWSYSASAETCRQDVFAHPRINIAGFTVLPSNRLNPLVEALVSSGGPIAVSVDATEWFMYGDGIYSDGSLGLGDFTLNHAVTLMGYQLPEGNASGFWDIKNSWGAYWGEGGHIRIEMKPEEERHCGWDWSSHDGVACDGDPDKSWVCGTCGILYDSVYPHGLHLVKPSP